MVSSNNPITFINDTYLSFNRPNGIEYTLSSWIYINDLQQEKQKYQFIFGRTTDASISNAVGLLESNTPCLYIAPNSNNIVIISSTFTSKKDNMITLTSIPIQQWINIAVICKGSLLTCYVNFKPIKAITLDSVPKQDGNICIGCAETNFNGYISNLLYAPKALYSEELTNYSSSLPNTHLIGNSGPISMNISNLDLWWK